jgi:hypothetical protein
MVIMKGNDVERRHVPGFHAVILALDLYDRSKAFVFLALRSL